MGMDAIAALARKAAYLQVFGQEKSAGLLTSGAKFLEHGAGNLGKFFTNAQHYTKPLASGGRAWSPVKTLGMGALGVGGALAAKDAFQGATGGWSGNNNLQWQNQRATGQAGAGEMMGAWGGSPLRSAASMLGGWGKGPDQVGGDAQYGPIHAGPNGQQVADVTHGSPTWSPRLQHMMDLRNQYKTRYDQMTNEASQGLKGMDPGEYTGHNEQIRRLYDQQKQQLDSAQQNFNQGNYGGHWYKPFGWQGKDYARQIAEYEAELKRAGMLGEGGQAAPQQVNSGLTPLLPQNMNYSGGYQDLTFGR